MKKVLFVATVTVHINAFHIPYLKIFKENGYEVHVASFGDEPIEYCDKHYNIPFARFPLKPQNYKAYKELKKIIADNNYEIIHCHTPVGGALTRLAAKKERKEGTRVIYTAHGFHFYKGASLINWMIYYPLEKWLSKYTDCLITINQEDYQLAKRKFKAKQTEFVHGVGVDESKFNFEMSDEEKHELRESLELRDNDFVIIYVAELSKRKNQGMLIQAIKQLINEGKENIKVILPGTDSLNGYYQKMVKNLKIEKNVKILGYREDVYKLLKICDLYISTSKQEGLPVNIIEAIMCRIPIIATNCRGNRDLLNADYLVEINNTNKLIDKITKKMNNQYSSNDEFEDSKYELKEVAKKMIQIYDIR